MSKTGSANRLYSTTNKERDRKMILEITPIYAVPLAVLMLILWVNVTKTRAANGISIGDAGDVALHEKIRRHGNFIEWVPIVLLMMLMAELRGVGNMWLHIAGILLVVSRALHPLGLKADAPKHPLRIVGNTGSLIALVICAAGIVYSYLG
jgi:uncharacterized membrane protein YecN with MAPEG domain